MRFDLLTLFPRLFAGFLGESLLKKAQERGLVEIHVHDIRTWSRDKHHRVDDRPFGGGPGMLLRVEPVVEAVEAVQASAPVPGHLVLLTPHGRRFQQSIAEEFARCPRLVVVCGRYEGFDHRIVEILKPDEVSLGDFVLNGGEVAAMGIVEAVTRLLPGVLGDAASSVSDSFSGTDRWLESPQYTRPREYRGWSVPDILVQGDHAEIAQWRRQESWKLTRERRADLLPLPPPPIPNEPAADNLPRSERIPTETRPADDS